MSQHRFPVPKELALTVLAEASVAMSALLSLEQWVAVHDRWLEDLKARVPDLDDSNDEQKDIRARLASKFDQVEALRRDLAELAADAEAVMDNPGANEIIWSDIPDSIPQPQSPRELIQQQAEFVQGLGNYMRGATSPLRRLSKRLRKWEDAETSRLADAIDGFIIEIHGTA